MAFVDDNNVIAIGSSTEANVRTLGVIEEKCKAWERTHGSEFNRKKFHLIHLAKARRTDLDRPITLGTQVIEAEEHIRILGVEIDQKLTGQAHLRKVASKTPIMVKTLRTLAGSNWGASLGAMRQVYLQAVRPALIYGSVLWFRPEGVLNAAKGMAMRLKAIQGKCLRAVAGAYRASSTEALEIETNVEPLDLYTGRLAAQAAARCRLSKAYNEIDRHVNRILEGRDRGRGRGYRGRVPILNGPVQKLLSWTASQVNKPLCRAQGTEEEKVAAAKLLVKEVKEKVKAQSGVRWRQKWSDGVKGAPAGRSNPTRGRRRSRGWPECHERYRRW